MVSTFPPLKKKAERLSAETLLCARPSVSCGAREESPQGISPAQVKLSTLSTAVHYPFWVAKGV